MGVGWYRLVRDRIDGRISQAPMITSTTTAMTQPPPSDHTGDSLDRGAHDRVPKLLVLVRGHRHVAQPPGAHPLDLRHCLISVMLMWVWVGVGSLLVCRSETPDNQNPHLTPIGPPTKPPWAHQRVHSFITWAKLVAWKPVVMKEPSSPPSVTPSPPARRAAFQSKLWVWWE